MQNIVIKTKINYFINLTRCGTPTLDELCRGECVCPCFSFLCVFNPLKILENVIFFLLVFCPCSEIKVKKVKLIKNKNKHFLHRR